MASTGLAGRHIVSTAWLQENLGEDGPRILDATVVLDIDTWEANTGRTAYDAEHIPGASFIDLIEELSDTSADADLPRGVRAYKLPSAEQFAKAVSAYGIEGDTEVVTYDTTGGMWAARLWWLFRVFGHDKVAVLDGGWAKWKAEGRPATAKLPAAPAPASFSPAFRAELLATKDEVKAISEAGDGRLVHALSPEMFSGEEQAALPRAGRIPGSVNVPFFAVYEEDGTFKSPEELGRLFSAVKQEDGSVVTYCGGGIAASSDALALALIGVDAAVYDGSLVEWAADDALPLVVD